MSRKAGFTILELMIVVAILAIILSVAIPSLQSARKAAAGTQAIGLLRTTCTVSEQYWVRFGGYASSETDLVNAGLIPDVNNSLNSAYNFTFSSGVTTWQMTADPKIPGTTGDNYFFVDQTGVIRFSTTGPATSASAAID